MCSPDTESILFTIHIYIYTYIKCMKMTRNFNHSVPRSLALSAHPDKQASMEPEEAKKAGEFAEIDSSIASMTINSE